MNSVFWQALLLCINFCAIFAYRTYQEELPNGNRVPSPCNSAVTWEGVGHELATGSGPRNPFGDDFRAQGRKWTVQLCRLDSDGDGKTNGEELGDPNCVWSKNATPAVTDVSKLSHPGICEPLNATKCSEKNYFLAKLDACQRVMNVTQADWCPAVKADDVKVLTLRFDETEVPSLETNYFCQRFQVPADQDYHIIAWEPIVVTPDIVHHLILFICDTPKSDADITKSGNYSKPMECGLNPQGCSLNQNIGWAFGTQGRCMPNEAGMLMGNSTYKTVILQIHYNNHPKKSGYRDSSGLKIYYTAKKRPNDMTQLRAGQLDISIPPRSLETKIIGRSFNSKNCSKEYFQGYSSYNITRIFFHMHTFGTHGKLYLEKANGKQVVLLDDKYDYQRPNEIVLNSPNYLTIEPGDNVLVECTYQTPDQDKWVHFGKNTGDEMCLAFMEVYPKPRHQNFVAIDSTGWMDSCQREQKWSKYCNDADLYKMLLLMTKDNSTSLAEECSDSSSSKSSNCCRYLASYNLLSYRCAYRLSHELIDWLLPSHGQLSINKIHSNVIKCINAIQLVNEEDLVYNSTTIQLKEFL